MQSTNLFFCVYTKVRDLLFKKVRYTLKINKNRCKKFEKLKGFYPERTFRYKKGNDIYLKIPLN